MSGALNMGNQNITNGGTITGTFVGNITGNVTGNTSGTAGGLTGTPNITVGVVTAASLDISGNVDVDGTLETDALTIDGVSLAETIADTVGAMVGSNTETGITVTYNDSDNTLDFVVGTLNQSTTGNAATATALATARAINGVNFDGTADITVTAAAGTLSGNTLASGVTASSLTSVGTLTGLTVSGNIAMTGTGAIDVPTGTTAQRPGSPTTGLFRYNSTEGEFEGYTASGWGAIAGGGGGASDFKYLALRNAANNGSASYPAADFTLVTSGTTSAISPAAANVLLVSVGGVIQQPNTGTSTPSSGFAISGSTIKFGSNISAAPDFIIYQVGGGIGEPSDNTITSAKIVDGAIVNADINASAAIAFSKLATTGALGSAITATTQSASDNSTKIATTAYTDTAISNLVDSSPSALNTLNELAAALGDDANFSTTVTNSIATKLPLAGGTLTGDTTLANTKKVIFNHSSGAGAYIKHQSGHFEIISSVGNTYFAAAGTLYLRSGGNTDALTLDTSQNATFAGNVTTGHHLTISGTEPRLQFTDSNNNPDFTIWANAGLFQITDATNSADRFKINSDGHIDISGNLDVGAGVDVTGNITVTGTVDGVDIAALNTTVGTKLPLAGGTLTGNLTLSGANPIINFTDTNNDSDFRIQVEAGTFLIEDATNSYADRFRIASDGTVDVFQNLNVGAGVDVTGNITVTGTVDGRDLATDGTKLDGIEASATADQTAAEILTAIKTVDGAGSGLDADLWDGNQFSSYLNQGVLTTSTPTFGNIYCNDWFRNNGSGEGLYNTANDAHFYSAGDNYWHLNGNSGDVNSGGLILYSSYNSSHGGSTGRKGYLYWSSSGFGLLDSTGSWLIRGDGANTHLERGQVNVSSNIICSGWYYNNASGEGLYNSATTQHFYSDGDDYWSVAGGTGANGIIFRDEHAGTLRGYVYCNNGNSIGFLNSGGSWALECSGASNNFSYNNFLPSANNSKNLGSSSLRWANLYVNDLQLSNEAKKDEGGNDVDGTWGDWTLQEGEENIFMINNRSGKKYRMALQEVN